MVIATNWSSNTPFGPKPEPAPSRFGFGSSNSATGSTNSSIFGVPNPSSFATGFTTGTSHHAFPSTTPGFGINSTKTPGFVFNSTSTSNNKNTFGVPNPPAFANGFTTGTSHAFPSTTPGFGINSTKTPGFVFNSTSTSNNNNTFGVPNPSAFANGFTTGTSHAFPSTTPGFGINSTKTAGFVFNSTSTSNNKNTFGIKSFTGSPGATKLKPTTGSRLSPYSATCVPAECTERFQSISAMPVYETKSHEELRLEDYELLSNKGSSNTRFGPKPEPAPSSQSFFGFPTSSGTGTVFGVPNTPGFGFGSSNSATGSTNSSIFGVPNPPAFANGFTTGTSHAFPSTTPGFGINSTKTPGFVFNSTSTSNNNNTFGVPNPSAFANGFTTGTSHAFPSTTPGFGINSTKTPGFVFNSTSTSNNNNTFGVPNPSAFANGFTTGTSHAFPSTTSGFGINSTKTPGFVFNSTSTSNNNDTFGVPNPSAFANGFTPGTSHAFPSTTPGFGINSTKTPGFVFNSTSTSNNNNIFGIKSFTGSPGATNLKPTTGSRLSPYSATCVPAECTERFQSISAMPVYETKSHEELRLEDYELLSNKGSSNTRFGPKPEPAPSSQSSFGFPTSSGTGTVFGVPNTPKIDFKSTPGFGFSSSNSATASTNSSVFGVPNSSTGFTTNTSHAIPSTTSGFVINSNSANASTSSIFGVPNPSGFATGFTTGTSYVFPSTTSGFGINSTNIFGIKRLTESLGMMKLKPTTGSRLLPYSATRVVVEFYGKKCTEKLESISAMPVYETKSHEELRLEDYELLRNKGSSNTPFGPKPEPAPLRFGFGSSNSATGSTNSSIFGVPNPSSFATGFTTGTSHAFPSTTPGFGINSTKTPGFVFNSTSRSDNNNIFGIKSLTGSPGATKLKPTTGSRLSPYSATCVPAEVNAMECTEKFQSISAMRVYQTKSHEELRLEDYELLHNHVRVYYPADESLEKKKKKIIDCSICLDQILIGAEGLPCCHLFHKDCIKKWLKKSRYCPVCRYQL